MFEPLDDEELRILAFLKSGTDDPSPAHTATSELIDRAITMDDEREAQLRGLGLNRLERERLRRRRQRGGNPRRANEDNAKAQALMRIGFYIDQRVDWSQVDHDRTEIIAAWAALSRYDVDLVNAWWQTGLHPSTVRQVTTLFLHGLGPDDLLVVVAGKRIGQHLLDGSTVDWCLLALDWGKRRAS